MKRGWLDTGLQKEHSRQRKQKVQRPGRGNKFGVVEGQKRKLEKSDQGESRRKKAGRRSCREGIAKNLDPHSLIPASLPANRG